MRSLLLLQFRIEFRRRTAFLSLILYLLCLVFINYFALGIAAGSQSPIVWSALFWMALLFTSIHTLTRSVLGERQGTTIYLYSIVPPASIIFARILYGFFLCTVMNLGGFLLFAVLLGNPVEDTTLFVVTLILTAYGFSASLTLLSAIAAKANNSSVVMAVMSFPLIIGLIVMAIRLTRNSIDGLEIAVSYDELLIMAAINMIVTAVSYLLFPYIWRS